MSADPMQEILAEQTAKVAASVRKVNGVAKQANTVKQFKPVDALAIYKTDYPPPEFVIEDLLPRRGLALAAGRPKVGKSWLTFNSRSRLRSVNWRSDGSGLRVRAGCRIWRWRNPRFVRITGFGN